jgi:hypothetical protein
VGGGEMAAYKVTSIQQTVGNRTSGFTRRSDQQNFGLGHFEYSIDIEVRIWEMRNERWRG